MGWAGLSRTAKRFPFTAEATAGRYCLTGAKTEGTLHLPS